MAAPHPQTATLHRSQTVQGLIQRVFGTTFRHLSKLQDRTIEAYLRSEPSIPKYLVKYFNPQDISVMNSVPPEEYSVRLSHKLLKTCCGLQHPRNGRWNCNRAEDTFEYLITFCWTEYENLQGATAVTDDSLNVHMNKILEALVLLVEKVEHTKTIDETALKTELKKHIGEELDTYDNGPCFQHTYTILCEHAVHQMLVMVYRHLNRMGRMSLNNFLNYKRINLIPKTGFSNERKFLEGNPAPEKMPIRILFRVVPRVCFDFEVRRMSRRTGLEQVLHLLKLEYNSPPSNEAEYTDKCYKVFELLETSLHKLCTSTGKDRKLIIGKLARETFVAESIQKPFEHPFHPKDSARPSDQACITPEESSAPPAPATPTVATTPTTAASEKDGLLVEEVNVCVLFKVMRPGGLVSKTLAMVFKALKGDLAITQSKKSVWKNVFTSDERDIMKNANHQIDLSVRDVTFLCKVLRHCCSSLSASDDAWQNNSDMIEYHIRVVRKERNKLAHDVSSMKTEELNDKLATIEDALLTILEKTESKLGVDEHKEKTALQNQIDAVKSAMQKMSQISYNLSFKNEWTEIKELRSKVKMAAQEELQQPHLYGESLQCLSPISGSSDARHKALTIEEVFMPRQLEDKNDVKAEGTHGIEDILFCQNSVLASFRVFIVHGRPGNGKTSVCKYLYHLWSRNVSESSQKGVELLFYVPCRYVTTKSLSSYLKAKYPKTFSATKPDDIIPLLQEPQVVFVVDGYDEAGEEAKGLIDEILTSLPDSKMIITTKTQWLPKLTDLVRRITTLYKVLHIVPMTEEDRHQYVRKFFGALRRDAEDCNLFLRYLDEMKEILSFIIRLPLTFSLLTLLWIEEPDKARKTRTLAQLYYRLTDLILIRVTKQLGQSDTFQCREWMITLGELAWDNLKKKKHYLSELDQTPLKRKAVSLGLGVEANNHIMSSLLYCEIQEGLVSSDKSWMFTFTSQQEYFAAEYLVDQLKNDKTMSLRNILELSEEIDENYKKKLQRLIPVIEFICGLMVIYDKVTEARVRELTEIMSVKEPWCLSALEKIFKNLLQDDPQIKEVLTAMFKGEKMSIFDNYEPQSTLWVLRNTSAGVQKEVTLKNSCSDLPQLKPLLDFLVLKSHSIKVMVDIDKVTNIFSLAQFSQEEAYKDIRFFFAPWKPLCISMLVMNWPFFTPLCLSLCPTLFPLVWWELLVCLLTMDKAVTRVVCSPLDPRCVKLIKEGASTLKAEVAEDHFLAPTEIIIHTTP